MPLAAVRSTNSLGLTNTSPWGSSAGLRVEHVGRKQEVVKTTRTYRTVASAEARDGRVRCMSKLALGILRMVVETIRASSCL